MIEIPAGGARRRWAIAVAGLMVVACSGDESVEPSIATPATTDPTSSSTVATVAESADSDEPSPTGEAAGVTRTVRIGVESGALAADIGIDVDDPGAGDPFGRFGSCSGLRTSLGPYSVLATDPEGTVRSISVLTDAAVDRPGEHAATVRIEPAVGSALVATGTVVLDETLTSGSYEATTVDGVSLAGAFECVGPTTPTPLEAGDVDGRVDTVEVVGLLRLDGAERVVGLAVSASSLSGLICRGETGGDGPTIVRVEGDRSAGAITMFELTDGTPPTMRFRVGEQSYEFDEVVVELDASETSGTFGAVGADGLAVDGAFRCS